MIYQIRGTGNTLGNTVIHSNKHSGQYSAGRRRDQDTVPSRRANYLTWTLQPRLSFNPQWHRYHRNREVVAPVRRSAIPFTVNSPFPPPNSALTTLLSGIRLNVMRRVISGSLAQIRMRYVRLDLRKFRNGSVTSFAGGPRCDSPLV